MRARLLVIAVFVSASTVPGVIALSTGVLPGEMSFAGGPKSASREFRVTSLGWPGAALGLAATSELVAWQQRSSDPSTGGLWVYDTRSQSPSRLIDAREAGRSAGGLSMGGSLVAWAERSKVRGHRQMGVRAYDSESRRLFTVTANGSLACISGDDIVWATKRGEGARTRYALWGLNTITDDRYALQTGGRVRDVAAYGRWIAWAGVSGTSAGVWAVNRTHKSRERLASAGTDVALDGQRVVWARRAGDETTVCAWNLRSRDSKEIYRVRAAVSSLALADSVAVWAQTTGDGDIWAYDFDRRRAYAVCTEDGEQTSPVLVGRTVFWADRRSGQWELYGRALQP